MALLGLSLVWPMPALTDQMVRIAVMAAVLYFVARPALDFHVQQWAGSLLIGVAIFALWIAPDLLFPSYRHSFLFENRADGIGPQHACRRPRGTTFRCCGCGACGR